MTWIQQWLPQLIYCITQTIWIDSWWPWSPPETSDIWWGVSKYHSCIYHKCDLVSFWVNMGIFWDTVEMLEYLDPEKHLNLFVGLIWRLTWGWQHFMINFIQTSIICNKIHDIMFKYVLHCYIIRNKWCGMEDSIKYGKIWEFLGYLWGVYRGLFFAGNLSDLCEHWKTYFVIFLPLLCLPWNIILIRLAIPNKQIGAFKFQIFVATFNL